MILISRFHKFKAFALQNEKLKVPVRKWRHVTDLDLMAFILLFYACLYNYNVIFRDVATAIVMSEYWEEALKNEYLDPNTGLKNTPIRKLIKKMPGNISWVFTSNFNTCKLCVGAYSFHSLFYM